jgi:hypothetical protein
MSHRSDPELLVLHTLRLKGFVDADVVAFACRQPEHVVHASLRDLRERGLVLHREGRISGWSLTKDGRQEGERRLAAEVDEAGCRPLVVDAYRRFLELNEPFLEACTKWQLQDGNAGLRTNDHDDGSYDAEIIAELDRRCNRSAPTSLRCSSDSRTTTDASPWHACACTTASTTGSRNR